MTKSRDGAGVGDVWDALASWNDDTYPGLTAAIARGRALEAVAEAAREWPPERMTLAMKETLAALDGAENGRAGE